MNLLGYSICILSTVTMFQVLCYYSIWETQVIHANIKIFLTAATARTTTLARCCHQCLHLKGPEYLHVHYTPETKFCFCNLMITENSDDIFDKTEVIYCVLTEALQTEKKNGIVHMVPTWSFPKDCLDLNNSNSTEDGVYSIWPSGGELTDAWCDMARGGWTVIQRRMDGSENFHRGWSDYVHGFGNRSGEYWLGLENMHRLTANGSELMIITKAFPGVPTPDDVQHYSNFHVGNASSKYVLNVFGLLGKPGPYRLEQQTGMPFSTFDNNNKVCAQAYRGGWWYNVAFCYTYYLNGIYLGPITDKSFGFKSKSATMMIKSFAYNQ